MNLDEKLQNLRVNYKLKSFDINDCSSDPIEQFQTWFKEAMDTKVDEPNAFTLSTVLDGKPKSRVVLLKGIEKKKFIFYTNYQSHKADEISKNANVALNFLWLPLERQIRIEGLIQKVDAKTSDEYFSKRPRESQIGAWASAQSSLLASREELEENFRKLNERFKSLQKIPRPDNWGGYEVEANYIEFWQGRISRLHDRIAYQKEMNGNWKLVRLSP